MSRKRIKPADAIRQKTLETVIEEFLRHGRLKNLSPRTLEYYEEDLSYFQRSVPVANVREVKREVMEDFIDHEMQKGNRITAINTRLNGLRVFFRFCKEREYMGDIGLKLLEKDETIQEPYSTLTRTRFSVSSWPILIRSAKVLQIEPIGRISSPAHSLHQTGYCLISIMTCPVASGMWIAA